MGEGKAKAKGKRQRHDTQRNDWDGWLKELESERPRAAAIVGAAFLDAQLEEVLESFFVDDKETRRLLNGPLSNFGWRIEAAYCLGFISPANLADLRLIGEIRNKFAHRLHGLSFEDPEVKSRCLKLKASKDMLEVMLDGALAQDPRQRFITSVVLLAQRLEMSAEAAKHQRRKVGPPYKPGKLVLHPRYWTHVIGSRQQ